MMGGQGYDDVLGINNKGFLALYSGDLNRILWKKYYSNSEYVAAIAYS